MLFRSPSAHIGPCVRQNRLGSYDVNPINLSQISSSHTIELASQVERWRVAMGPLSLSGFRQRAGVVVDLGRHAFQMLLNSRVATLDLLLVDLIERKILSYDKDQLVPPISQQALGDLIWRGLDAPVAHRSQAVWIPFSLYNRAQDS